jgi:hypothetical protein
MEGAPRDLRHAWHRHDPVRETSSRDPCLDHPGSNECKTATTQPAMVTPPAVLTVAYLFPNPYTAANQGWTPSWRGNRWMAGSKRFVLGSQGRTAIGSVGPCCLGHNNDP